MTQRELLAVVAAIITNGFDSHAEDHSCDLATAVGWAGDLLEEVDDYLEKRK